MAALEHAKSQRQFPLVAGNCLMLPAIGTDLFISYISLIRALISLRTSAIGKGLSGEKWSELFV
jgi:hypothetical protein